VGVHDRGPGIPDDFRGRIFGRFAQADSTFTRQKGGTGLGLSICKRLVESMNGQIGFENRPGGGTTFFFELPVVDEESAASQVAA
jgi:signal transduction histidine kinase